jgi:hypothetical protein
MNEDLREVLTILQEECAEVIVDISKCFRFGPDQIMSGQELSNIQRLEKEIGDVQAMIDLLVDLNIGVTKQGINNNKVKKFNKLKQWSNLKINK